MGNLDAAEVALRSALSLDERYVPAYLNLADVFRVRQRDGAGEEPLRRGLAAAPEAPALHHALGLLLVRRGRADAALQALEKATRLAPEETRYSYVYGVALNSMGRTPRALEVLADAHRPRPDRPRAAPGPGDHPPRRGVVG